MFADDLADVGKRVPFPADTIVPPGGYLQIELDKDGWPGFALGGDEELGIWTADGMLVAMVDWAEGQCGEGQSCARVPDATGNFQTTSAITPGEPNPSVTISVADTQAEEGEDLKFTVSLSYPLSSSLRLRWGVVQSPALRGEDYHRLQYGRLTVGAGQDEGTVTVTTVEDDRVEDDETLGLHIFSTNPSLPAGVEFEGNPANGILEAVGAILNDD